MTPEARLRQRARFPVLALTAAAWVALLVVGMPMASPNPVDEVAPLASPAPLSSPAPGHQHLLSAGAPMTLGGHLGAVLLMLVAMMAPLLIPALRHVLDRSLPSHRARAAALLAAGYATTWIAGWAVLVLLATALTRGTGPGPALAAGLLVAFVWQVCPPKQRALNRCHARPALAAFGWAADRAVLGFGVRQASWCVGSCWALMLLPLLVPGHSMLAMAAVALWMWAERFENPAPVGWRLRVPATAIRILRAQVLVRARSTPGLRSRA